MKQSLGVLAATEVRCQGEAVTGEIKARESRIPAGHHSVLPEVCSQNSVWGPGALEHVPFGPAVLTQPLLELFLSPVPHSPSQALRTCVRGCTLNECRSPVRFRTLG